MKTLDLVPLTPEMIAAKRWTSCYGRGDIPIRFRWLRAECADSLPSDLVFSDIYRSPMGSLAAVESQRGALPPGYSNHNYGGAVDLDVDATMRKHGMRRKEDLDDYMAIAGWHCHRSDHQLGSESWHYNHLPSAPAGRLSSDEAEAHLVSLYGSAWDALRRSVKAEQVALKASGKYEGLIDGDAGPMTRAGRKAFERSWNPRDREVWDYHRVLWLVAASLPYEPPRK